MSFRQRNRASRNKRNERRKEKKNTQVATVTSIWILECASSSFCRRFECRKLLCQLLLGFNIFLLQKLMLPITHHHHRVRICTHATSFLSSFSVIQRVQRQKLMCTIILWPISGMRRHRWTRYTHNKKETLFSYSPVLHRQIALRANVKLKSKVMYIRRFCIPFAHGLHLCMVCLSTAHRNHLYAISFMYLYMSQRCLIRLNLCRSNGNAATALLNSMPVQSTYTQMLQGAFHRSFDTEIRRCRHIGMYSWCWCIKHFAYWMVDIDCKHFPVVPHVLLTATAAAMTILFCLLCMFYMQLNMYRICPVAGSLWQNTCRARFPSDW